MKGLSLGLIALALLGCGEPDDTAGATSAPPAVAPVEVSASEDAPEDDPAAMRARIAELEAELAAARGEGGTETAAIPEVVPEGVAIPGEEAPGGATAAANTGAANTGAANTGAANTGAARAGRTPAERREPSLLDTVLGDDDARDRARAGERTARSPRELTEEVLELPGALLGE